MLTISGQILAKFWPIFGQFILLLLPPNAMLRISGPNFPHFDDLNFFGQILVQFWSICLQMLTISGLFIFPPKMFKDRRRRRKKLHISANFLPFFFSKIF